MIKSRKNLEQSFFVASTAAFLIVLNYLFLTVNWTWSVCPDYMIRKNGEFGKVSDDKGIRGTNGSQSWPSWLSSVVINVRLIIIFQFAFNARTPPQSNFVIFLFFFLLCLTSQLIESEQHKVFENPIQSREQCLQFD